MKYKSITGFNKDELISLTGIKGFSKFYEPFPCRIDPPAISIQIEHNHQGIELKRTIHSTQRLINNELCRIQKKGNGEGLSVLRSQLEFASKSGFNYVYCEAYGKPEFIHKWNGFVTWGKLGFRMFSNFQTRFVELVGQYDPTIVELSDLLSTNDGQKFWCENGFSWRGKFDLESNSKSWNILNEYLKRKNIL